MKKLALKVLRSCGGFSLSRKLTARSARILMYHDFSAFDSSPSRVIGKSALHQQFSYLKRHFHVVPLSELTEKLRTGGRFHTATVAITVDDGRRNFYDVAFPVLQELEIPATLFAVSSFVNGEDWIWTDKVLWLSCQPSAPQELAEPLLDGFFARLNVLRPEERDQSIANIAARMGTKVPPQPPEEYAACSWTEIRTMADSGLVEIGAHTVSHPILTTLTHEESWREIWFSKTQLELGLGRSVKLFCFPNGKVPDYGSIHLAQVREAGYEGAVTACSGMVTTSSNPYQLPRMGISGFTDFLSFSKSVSGVEYYQESFQKVGRARSD